jgi:hypothetical protein
VLEGMSTNTKDGVLISNGMILVEAESNGQKIEIAKNKSINIKIPSQSVMNSMGVYTLDNVSKNWEKSNIEIKLDTCANYRQNIITKDKTVTKAEYKKWKKEEEAKQKMRRDTIERIFGGRSISIGSIRRPKSYTIPIPIDTIWECADLDVSYFTFGINALGWYNIDKLKKVPKHVNIIMSTSEDLQVFLLIKRENICVLGSRKGSNTYEFRKMPSETYATIVAYHQNDRETINVSIKTIYLRSGKVELSPTQKITVGEFRKLVKLMK